MIGNVEIRGNLLYVRDEKGRNIKTVPFGKNSELVNFTANGFVVKREGVTYYYDAKANLKTTTKT